MDLSFRDLEFDSFGNPETPELQLRTLDNQIIGMVSNFFDLKITVKFAEPSEISFTVPRYSNGVPTPFFDDLMSYKLLYTKHYGIYVIYGPSSTSDGIEDNIEVEGYSLEKTLENRKFFLEEGTFNLWNPGAPENTLIGRLCEIATGWKAGYISPSLIGRYRTFEEFDDYLLSFCYNTAPEKYRCIFFFDTYEKTINCYDADEERPTVPIYLDFDNLVEQLDVDENTDEMCTAMRPYGADSLDIRDVNPIGTNWIYDLSYFIENGDISPALATKYQKWQREIATQQNLYRGLVSMKAAATAQLLMEKAKLVDLKGEETDLTNQQSVTVQALAMEVTQMGKDSTQAKLDEVNKQLAAKKAEVAAKEKEVEALDKKINGTDAGSYTSQIQAIVDRLAIDKYFTAAEYETLTYYLIEQDLTEETFVATDIDVGISGTNYNLTSGSASISGSEIIRTDLTKDLNKYIYSCAGGTFRITGTKTVTGNVIRATLDYGTDKTFTLSIYADSITAGDATASAGVVTMTGVWTGAISADVKQITEQEVVTEEGTQFSLNIGKTTMFITAEITDFQRYSVQMDLYEYAMKKLHEFSQPIYEFDVDSANFIFAREFEPFRDSLSLGKCIYLRMNDDVVRTPILIEIELDFEDHSELSLTFCNRFRRTDKVSTMKQMLDSSYSSSRSFDAGKYIYNQTAGRQAAVTEFMNSSLDAAKNTILSSKNQSVSITGAGIQVSGDSNYQLRLVDSMIAMTDDGWQHAKLAIGRFASPEVGEYWGVNADVIGGKLLVGNNLIIENTNDTGIMQFRVDATGAWLYNSTFILSADPPSPVALTDKVPIGDGCIEGPSADGDIMVVDSGILPIAASKGGKIIIDPRYGIVGGTGDLFTTQGTTVIPSFIDEDGEIELDKDKFPKNANFYVDMRDGSAYFRGTVQSTKGKIGGWSIDKNKLTAGSGATNVTLWGEGGDWDAYAFWAGGSDPTTARFWVKKNGDMSAASGTFTGSIDASSITSGILDTGRVNYGPANEYTKTEITKYDEGIRVFITTEDEKRTTELNVTIDGVKSTVTANYNDLDGKINQNYNTLSEKITGNYTTLSDQISEVEQTAGQISSTVKENYKSLSDLIGTNRSDLEGLIGTNRSDLEELIGTNRSDLEALLTGQAGILADQISEVKQTAGEISSTVKSNYQDLSDLISENYTDLEGIIDGQVKLLTDEMSEIKQTAGEISSTVSANYKTLDDKINTTKNNLSKDINDNYSNLTKDIEEREKTLTKQISEIDQKAGSISTTVTNFYDDYTEEISQIKQTAKDISATVTDHTTQLSTTLSLDSNGVLIQGNGGSVKIGKGNLSLSGAITFSELSDTVTNTIDDKATKGSLKTTNDNLGKLETKVDNLDLLTESEVGTIIDRKLVSAPIIAGGKFANRTSTGEAGDIYLKITRIQAADSFAFVGLTSNESTPFFEIRDSGMGTPSLHSYGTKFLQFNASTKVVSAIGNWNFEGASVTGITATAVFGS